MNRVGIKDQVVYNVTNQSLTFYCPWGRPSSDGTVALYDPRYGVDPLDSTKNPIVSGTATRAAIDVTMNGDAGPTQSDPRNVPVSAANMTAISALLAVGDYLVLTNASQQVEVVEIAKIGTSSIGALDPLIHSYASGALVQSAKVTSPVIPAAWIQDKLNLGSDFYALWTLTVGGVTYRPRSYFDVVRQQLDTNIRLADIIDMLPDFARGLSEREQVGFVREARREVDKTMRQRGIRNPERLMGTEVYQSLVRDCLPWIVARAGRRPNGFPTQADYLPVARDQWDSAATAFLEGKLIVPIDQNNDDSLSADERNAAVVDLEM